MLLNDIFDQLAYGELAHLFIGPNAVPSEGIPVEKRKGIFLSVQLGLTELHKRFLLREASLTIGITAGKLSYTILPKYAASNTKSTESNKYILDTDSPFRDDLLKIERVYSPDGTELPLNIVDDSDSIMVTSFNTIVIPDDYEETSVIVKYRADHPALTLQLAVAAPSITEIELPRALLDPLLLFIASRVHTKPGAVDQLPMGNIYTQKFELACSKITDLNYQSGNSGVNMRLVNNGWA